MLLTKDIDMEDFKPWSGAVTCYDKLSSLGKLEDFAMLVEECYPKGLGETTLNDLLWFEDEWYIDVLGIPKGDWENAD